MVAFWASLLLLTLVQQGDSQLSNAQKQLLLDIHNQARSDVFPTAANMEEMVWNDELAQVAQSYSDQCTFQHNSDRVSQQGSFDTVGENLAITSESNDTYEDLFSNWLNEANSYNFTTNSCSMICGHYTQVVWTTSGSLGCGATNCSSVNGFADPNALLLVCNYGPGGNIIGQSPYSAGVPCSSCPDSKPYCSNNLCTSNMIIDPTNTTTIANTTSPELNSAITPVATSNAPDITESPVGPISIQPTPTSDSSGTASVMSSQCFAFAVLVAVLSIISHY